MRIEKKHKIYAGLVGAALLAWGIDAMFFESYPAGPAIAAASTTPPSAPETSTVVPQPITDDSASANRNKWLSEQLKAWSVRNPASLDDTRDVFSASKSWAQPKPALPAPSKTAEQVAQEFQREHHLTAVVLSGAGGSALIDGRLLHIGQSVDGCRLRAVASGCADLITTDGLTFRIVIGTEPPKASR